MSPFEARLLCAILGLDGPAAHVTHLAALLSVSKSTVSRGLQTLEGRGLCLRRGRQAVLTEAGRTLARGYHAQVGRMSAALERMGVPAFDAVADSYALMTTLSAPVWQAILRQCPAQGADAGYLAGLEDGIYPLPFALFTQPGRGGSLRPMRPSSTLRGWPCTAEPGSSAWHWRHHGRAPAWPMAWGMSSALG